MACSDRSYLCGWQEGFTVGIQYLREVGVEALIYGYLRDDLADGRGAELEEQLRALANARGFCFATTFHESSTDGAALVELTEELKRADAHHVVVPSLDHFAGHVIPRRILVEKLTRDAAARIWTVDTAAGEAHPSISGGRSETVERVGKAGEPPGVNRAAR
ncbi:recombinase family protein [Nocardia heshunensis]